MAEDDVELMMEELEESTDDEDAARVELELEIPSDAVVMILDEVLVIREDAATIGDVVLLKTKDERLEVWEEELALLE